MARLACQSRPKALARSNVPLRIRSRLVPPFFPARPMIRRFQTHPQLVRNWCRRRGRVLFGLLWVASLGPTAGCQQWPGTSQARQFQQDSERLLNEFRAEKQRADELAAKNHLLEQRLADTEKQYALQNLAGSRNRNQAPRNSGTQLSIGGRDANNQLSQSNTSRSTSGNHFSGSNAYPGFTGPGLPDARPGTGSRFTSTTNSSSAPRPNSGSATSAGDKLYDEIRSGRSNSGANPYAPQWRPIYK